MPHRDTEKHALILKARMEFDRNDRISLDTASKLYGLGLIPSRIEDNWSAQR